MWLLSKLFGIKPDSPHFPVKSSPSSPAAFPHSERPRLRPWLTLSSDRHDVETQTDGLPVLVDCSSATKISIPVRFSPIFDAECANVPPPDFQHLESYSPAAEPATPPVPRRPTFALTEGATQPPAPAVASPPAEKIKAVRSSRSFHFTVDFERTPPPPCLTPAPPCLTPAPSPESDEEDEAEDIPFVSHETLAGGKEQEKTFATCLNTFAVLRERKAPMEGGFKYRPMD
jgi:hypothetical protein